MNTDKLSRRRMLSGFLAALTGWLCPSSPHVRAAHRRPVQAADPQPSQCMHRTISTYDGMGGLVRVTEYPPRPIELPLACDYRTLGQSITYHYYGGEGNGGSNDDIVSPNT